MISSIKAFAPNPCDIANQGRYMHCPMLNKKCQRSFCMAFTHRKIRDANGCHEMHGYCRHYKVIMKGTR